MMGIPMQLLATSTQTWRIKAMCITSDNMSTIYPVNLTRVPRKFCMKSLTHDTKIPASFLCAEPARGYIFRNNRNPVAWHTPANFILKSKTHKFIILLVGDALPNLAL